MGQLNVLGSGYLMCFFLYVVLASFLLFNLLLGLVVIVATTGMQASQQSAIVAAINGCDDGALVDKVVRVLAEAAGKNYGDSVSRHELQQLMLDGGVTSNLYAVGLDVPSIER